MCTGCLGDWAAPPSGQVTRAVLWARATLLGFARGRAAVSSWWPFCSLCRLYTTTVATSPVSPPTPSPAPPPPPGCNLPACLLCPSRMNECLRDMPGYEHTSVYLRKKASKSHCTLRSVLLSSLPRSSTLSSFPPGPPSCNCFLLSCSLLPRRLCPSAAPETCREGQRSAFRFEPCRW